MNITQSRTDWNDLVDQMDDEERIKLRKVLFSILTNRFTVSEMKFSLRIHALIGNKIKAGSDKDAVADELYEHARAEDKVGNLIHSMIHHKTKGRAVQKDLMNNKSFISLPDGDSHQKVNIYLESLPSGGEEGPITVDLPYTDLQLKAVLRALQLGDETTSEFPQYIDSLTELGLMKNNTLKADLDQQVGKDLFDTLFSNRDMYAKLRSVLQSKPVALQLRFSKKAVALSRYPWELLHDGDKFLGMQGGGLQITRYIEFSDPPSPLEVEFPWRVLFISPRPRDKPPLPDTKVPALIRALSNFECEQIEPPTYDALKDKLAKARRDGQPYHIIHFDGHGNVDLMCPKCKKAYGPALEICPECGFDLTWGTNPKGYLYFENSNPYVLT
jgi:hypothetical protein